VRAQEAEGGGLQAEADGHSALHNVKTILKPLLQINTLPPVPEPHFLLLGRFKGVLPIPDVSWVKKTKDPGNTELTKK
jgi:hypothetical protein